MGAARVIVASGRRGIRWRAGHGAWSDGGSETLPAVVRRLRVRELVFADAEVLVDPAVWPVLAELGDLVESVTVVGRRWDVGAPLGRARWLLLALTCADVAAGPGGQPQSTTQSRRSSASRAAPRRPA